MDKARESISKQDIHAREEPGRSRQHQLDSRRISELVKVYRDGLLEDTVPFWLNHAIDEDHGGFTFALDRDGTLLSTDKYIWLHGRFVWLLATLYTQVEPRPEWLRWARHGLDFLNRHGFAENGKMYFSVDQQGGPLRMRRYIFSESFMVIALAAYSQATNDAKVAQEAVDLFKQMLKYVNTPGLLEPKVNPQTRPMKGLAIDMIMITTAQTLRQVTDDPVCDQTINQAIAEIESDFMHHDLRAVLETVGPNGEFIDTFEGRTVLPGHAIEASWFILQEAIHRDNDPRLCNIGLTILDWMFKAGWDKQYGGLLYFVDAKGLSCSEYWHDMKFWWPHNETIIAALLAYQLTGDPKYIKMHDTVHEWAYSHFADPQYGEWFGYLHRDGSVSTQLKGNQWKGPFHLPRMQLLGWKTLESLKGSSTSRALTCQPKITPGEPVQWRPKSSEEGRERANT